MNNFCCANLRLFIVHFLEFLLCSFKIFCCAKNWNRYPPRRAGQVENCTMCQVPCLPTEGSLQNGVEYRKAICKKCIMPINTSHGQLPPVRRGGYRLYFFSLAKEQSLPAAGLPTVGRQDIFHKHPYHSKSP